LAKTYIKIYGPPLMKALQALEGVAVAMSKENEVKFMHKCVPYPTRMQADTNDWSAYLKNLSNTYVDCYEPQKLISDAKQTLGEHDFMFDWVEKPTVKNLEKLIEKIDTSFQGLGVLYTMTTDS